MHTADDDSIPVPHDAFRMPRGVLQWKTPYVFALLVLGGGYGVLALMSRLFTDAAAGAREPLQLPLLAQLASALAGLAALVLVLSRAVREVDKRPYVAIAPVFAAFAGLVHAGVHGQMAALGAISTLVAYAALAVALVGGALLVRDYPHAQRIGWGLVVAPSALILLVVSVASGAPNAPDRAWLVGLLLSSLTLGAAGVAARRLRSAMQTNASGHAREPAWAEELDDAKTRLAPAAQVRARRADTVRVLAPRVILRIAMKRRQMAAIACAVALVTYFGVRSLRRAAETLRAAPSAAFSAPAPTPIIEQLSKSDKAQATGRNAAVRSSADDKPATKQTGAVLHIGAPLRSTEASPPARRAIRAASKPARALPSTTPASNSPAGLPAWGELGSARPVANPRRSKLPTATPTMSPAPAALASSRPAPNAQTKPAAPVKPEPPPKPLTMEQVLDRVEDVAKAQRRGKAAAKSSKRDAELDALISGSMKSRSK